MIIFIKKETDFLEEVSDILSELTKLDRNQISIAIAQTKTLNVILETNINTFFSDFFDFNEIFI